MKRTLSFVLVTAALLTVVIAADRRISLRRTSEGFSGEFPSLNGKPINLAPYKGQVVLINFWATFCKPCITEIPWMNEFQEKYGPRGYQSFGINMDEEGAEFVKKWLAEPQMGMDRKAVKLTFNYPQFLGDYTVGEAYGGLFALPTTLLINRRGEVVKRYIGISSKDKFEKAIEELLDAAKESSD